MARLPLVLGFDVVASVIFRAVRALECAMKGDVYHTVTSGGFEHAVSQARGPADTSAIYEALSREGQLTPDLADYEHNLIAAILDALSPGEIPESSFVLKADRPPCVGDMVHYRDDGHCRAACITFTPGGTIVDLCVVPPGGIRFEQLTCHDPGTYGGGPKTAVPGGPIPLPLTTCKDLAFKPGTWHRP